MKKVPIKRPGIGSANPCDLMKPFDFCCDVKRQDPDTRYNLRNPPFKSSLTDVLLDGGGPDLKFRVQEAGKPPYPIQWGGTSRPKGAAWLGDCKRCRGPLRWYLEEEISSARDTLARERQAKHNLEAERNVEIGMRKARKRNERKRGRIKRENSDGDEGGENGKSSGKMRDRGGRKKLPVKRK